MKKRERIGIVVAMQKEMDCLLKFADKYEINNVFGNRIYDFGNGVFGIVSGVGEIQAAMATTLLITAYDVERIVNFGYVGSVCPDLKQGDIISVRNVFHCDMNLTLFGNKPGQYNERDIAEFTASDLFNGFIRKDLSSSDAYLNPGEELDRITAIFGENILDMEGAGIAVVCTKSKVPFSMLKCVSDGVSETHEDYIEFSERNGIEYCAEQIYKKIF